MNTTYSVFIFKIARLDMITSLTDFLNDLQKINHMHENTMIDSIESTGHNSYLNVKYIGRMANNGNVCTLIIITINVTYNTDFIKPITSSLYKI